MDVTQIECSNEDPLLCCRACLSTDARLFNIHEYKLADAFTRIVGTAVTMDMPQHLCVYCGTLLRKCASFRDMCLHTQQCLITELNAKLDPGDISKINSTQVLNLTITDVKTVECIDIPLVDNIKQEPICIVDIDSVIKKPDTRTELVNEKNVPAKLTYIKNRVRKIENTFKRKKDITIDDDNDDKDDDIITETKIKMEFDDKNSDEIKKEFDIEDDNDDDVSNVRILKKPIKKQGKNKKTVVKNQLEMKIIKSKDIKVREVNRKKVKRKMRNPENNYMPEFDFAKFESTHAVKIVTLSKEEQLEEIAARKKSQNYLESRFRCETCGKGFNAEPAFNNHLARHSPSEGEFACEICAIRYKKKYRWQVHQDVHRLKFVCNECSYVSRDRGQAKRHYDMHAGKTYKCQHCEKSFNKMTSYLTHIRVVHPAQCAACDVCGETFVGENGLRMHKNRAHSEKSQQFKCTTCSANFHSLEALNRHTDTAGEHGDLRPCEQCGENCASEQALQEHVKETHPKKTYRCEECDMAFPDATALSVHTKRKHLNQRPSTAADRLYNRKVAARRRAALRGAPPKGQVVCEQCGQIMPNATLLRYHQRRHDGVKPFACTQCPKTFYYKTSLDVHILTHTGERPFQCPECPLAFVLKGHLKRHHKTAHQGIRDNIPCSICGRVFSTKSALTTHVNSVHHGQPWPKRDRSKRKSKPNA
ncbi:zinc finger protein 35-like [Cydia fagiglandana]|uniref:zinc finger protein 35-like n=1 Tax=Cydia fagiglandana TaxID=1458189 RepID=UPI002FEE1089